MTNPLLAPWTAPFGLPPFAEIKPEHFEPAFDAAMTRHMAEIEAIAAEPAAPTFANTIEALEGSGRDLSRVAMVFFNLASSHTNDAIQKIEREIAPRLARHQSGIYMNASLFARVDDLFARRKSLGLTAEQDRVLELYHDSFVRAGARLTGAERERMQEIMQRLATLGAGFSQNVLADENAYELALGEDDLDGLPDFLLEAAKEAARDRGKEGYVITLNRSLIAPFLQFSDRRELREAAFRGWIGRGETGGETDNRGVISETVALRAERARLLGFDSFADYKLATQMAKTPDAVRELLLEVWTPARTRALEERDQLQDLIAREGGNFDLAPWDWRYYAEKLRKELHDLDEAELKPYLQLEKMIEAAFDVASRLFGLSFTPLEGVALHHPDARAWEVRQGGRHMGVFIGDYFARPSKRGGAWMSGFRDQENFAGEVRPIVMNNCNFAKGAGATLLTFDDARTLFHEFGHALHGLLTDVRYPYVSGTSVARDFVELPSQLYEHWLATPEVLGKYAVHYRTGEPMPKALVKRLLAAETYGQGFATVEYVSSALVDLEMHLLADAEEFDPTEFEGEVLSRIGMPAEIVMRHRSPHFQHVFAGDGYSAGYYSYMWSEVMDADAFDAFAEAGDPFDVATAARLAEHVYAAGGRQDPAEAYMAFRGRMPEVGPLLKGRGLAAAS
jgi:peptidyl-dipeptidase Dcp